MIVKGPATTAAKVADYLVWHSQKHGDPISNLKLQKLLYYAFGWFLVLEDQQLFGDAMKAWVRGPVVPTVYHKYKSYAWQPISSKVAKPDVPARVEIHLQDLMQVYGDYSAYTLEELTHKETPWLNARKGIAPHQASSRPISLEDVSEYFAALAQEK